MVRIDRLDHALYLKMCEVTSGIYFMLFENMVILLLASGPYSNVMLGELTEAVVLTNQADTIIADGSWAKSRLALTSDIASHRKPSTFPSVPELHHFKTTSEKLDGARSWVTPRPIQ